MQIETESIDGKALARALTDQIGKEARRFADHQGLKPGLAVILVGEDAASQVYVRNKKKMASACGFLSRQLRLPATVDQSELLALLDALNQDKNIHGILVQLPLPTHLDEGEVLLRIDPGKDVDGFHPINVGLLGAGQLDKALVPCTPAGCVLLAKQALGEDLSGAHCVIVGRSNIVGKPAAQLFLHENCTVTIAHSRAKNLMEITREADILVAAVGRPRMISGEMVKKGATLIDVGINRVDASGRGAGKTRLVGDIDFAGVQGIASHITPVPGGVGPMTIAMLMRNTFTAAQRQKNMRAAAK